VVRDMTATRDPFGGGIAHRQQATLEQASREYRAPQPGVRRPGEALGRWNTTGSMR